MSEQFPLRLDTYFYIEQNVDAVPEYDIEQPTVNKYKVIARVQPAEQENKISAWVTVELDKNESTNFSYTHRIEVFGVFIVANSIPSSSGLQIVKELGVSLLIGAIRERLLLLTSTGPWLACYIDFIPLTEIQFV